MRYYSFEEFMKFVDSCKLDIVPILNSDFVFNKEFNKSDSSGVEQIISFVEGQSLLNKKVKREGVIFKTYDGDHIALKCINNKYLLKYGD